MTNKQELLKKLKALAEQGVGGEQINARKKFEQLMKKYGISDDDLSDEVLFDCEFTYHGDEELRLLNQIIYKVKNERDSSYGFTYTYSGRNCRTKRGCKATRAQKIEIEFLFDFYKKLYEKEKKVFMFAFVQKHQLFGSLKDGEKPLEMDLDVLHKLNMFSLGLDDEKPLKQITENV